MTVHISPSWLALCAGAVLSGLALWVLRDLRSARRRRENLEKLRREAVRDTSWGEVAKVQPGSMDRERSAWITRRAETAALRSSRGENEVEANPFAPGSREFVLWEASFHAAASDLSQPEPAVPSAAAERT